MWMKFPKGTTNISVEKQEFKVEHRDKEGDGYFRVPAHFVPKITALNMGFGIVPERPEGAPDDLPELKSGEDSALADIGRQLEAAKKNLSDMRSDLEALTASNRALVAENAGLKEVIAGHEKKILELEEKLEDEDEKA